MGRILDITEFSATPQVGFDTRFGQPLFPANTPVGARFQLRQENGRRPSATP